jgi:hypothetical protein
MLILNKLEKYEENVRYTGDRRVKVNRFVYSYYSDNLEYRVAFNICAGADRQFIENFSPPQKITLRQKSMLFGKLVGSQRDIDVIMNSGEE